VHRRSGILGRVGARYGYSVVEGGRTAGSGADMGRVGVGSVSGEGEEVGLLLFLSLNERRGDGRPVILWNSCFLNQIHRIQYIYKVLC